MYFPFLQPVSGISISESEIKYSFNFYPKTSSFKFKRKSCHSKIIFKQILSSHKDPHRSKNYFKKSFQKILSKIISEKNFRLKCC